MTVFVKRIPAFTLIELLAVIAIIAVLVVLILGAASSMTGRARDAKSLSNLSQIAKGLNLYASDNGAFPSAAIIQSDHYWTDDVKPYLGNQKSIFTSPNEKKHGGLHPKPLYYDVDYGINNLVILPGTQRRPAAIPRPAHTVMVCDARNNTSPPVFRGSWMVAGQQWVNRGDGLVHVFNAWPPRNSGGMVYAAFCDGHVETISDERWKDDRAALFDPNHVP